VRTALLQAGELSEVASDVEGVCFVTIENIWTWPYSQASEREIVTIEVQDHDVVVTLSCGHSFTWQEKWSFTAQQWADMLRKHWIGEKWPCKQCQGSESKP
jgi:hypothetical protein